jgi:hypothetical protein
MKKSVLLALLVTVAAGVQAQVVSVKYGSELIPSGGLAGAVLAPNWNNSASMNFSVSGSSLLDNSGAATTIAYTLATPQTWGGWQIGATPSQDADGSYNKLMLNQYLNSAPNYGNPESLSLSGISYGQYDLYVYFSSDAAGRNQSITLGSTTYDFSTVGAPATSGANAVLTQSTSTTGAYPMADYVVFSGLTGGSQTVNLDSQNGSGISAFQIVAVPEPSTMALAGLGGLGLCVWRRRTQKV